MADYTPPLSTDSSLFKKHGDDVYIYGDAEDSNPLSNTLDNRRGAALGFAYGTTETQTWFIPNPIPQISISITPQRNKFAYLGHEYNINLDGYIVPSSGLNTTAAVGAIFAAQKHMTDVFGANNLHLSLQTAKGASGVLTFPVVLENVNFEPGPYVNYCKYSASFKAFTSYSGYFGSRILNGSTSSLEQTINGYPAGSPSSQIVRGWLEDFNEEWNYEYATDFGVNSSSGSLTSTEGYWKISRTVSAVGRDITGRTSPTENEVVPRLAWEYAYDAIDNYASAQGDWSNQALNSGLFGTYFYNDGSTAQTSSLKYESFNFEQSFSINKGAGSVQMTQSWLVMPSGYANVASGSRSLESFSKTVSHEKDGAYTSVSIEGTIKGLSKLTPLSHTTNNLYNSESVSGKYANALSTYSELTRKGNFGICPLFNRAQAGLETSLNSQPLSISIGQNPQLGEITYNISYDNRPSNWFRGVLSENISIQDTYPGDLYSLVNVIGRPTGPVIQYGSGRTEYRRSATIEIVVGYGALSYSKNRSFVYSKPSVSQTFREDLKTLLESISPANEPGIRKYLQDPPQETWNPITGQYTLQLNWIYELSE